jgi:hypothetical protein
MEKIFSAFKNINGSPRTTIAGGVCMALGGYLIYEMGVEELTYTSIQGGLFLLGLYLFVLKAGKDDEVDEE